MKLKKAIEILDQHHTWRQGFHTNMVNPAELTAAIAIILQTLRELKYATV
jgi:threonine/homoserine/homoserine lactone efflux protein